MRLICCMGGTGGGKGGEAADKEQGDGEKRRRQGAGEGEAGRTGLGVLGWGGGSAGRRTHGAPCQRSGKELGSKRRSGAKRSGQPAPHKALRDWQARPSKMKIS